jgi:hypothetical protein
MPKPDYAGILYTQSSKVYGTARKWVFYASRIIARLAESGATGGDYVYRQLPAALTVEPRLQPPAHAEHVVTAGRLGQLRVARLDRGDQPVML